ncbi:hypothetical protein ATP_00458 [Candidatus Phytoplasma mali]|uniref:Sequence-variable mosaic (SVM) signal sequence domain-containing protein n=1 Tax=Phytoplasma mali (strain AT) TaxID=482235 RepID=B3R0R1_PHYMT|nr:hypothetical protein [Candidatus Phytoplasma mali]CAP18645.1 hypothetical protein ATP_00458 [Candidatus Phytoplasma mali]
MFKLKNAFKILNGSYLLSLLLILFSHNYVQALENHQIDDHPESSLNEIQQRINELSTERNRIMTQILNYRYYNPEIIEILTSRYQNLNQIIINLEQQMIILTQAPQANHYPTNYQNHNGNHSNDDNHDNRQL